MRRTFAILATLLVASGASAQPADDARSDTRSDARGLWYSAGLGVSSEGLGATSSIDVRRGPNVLTLRSSAALPSFNPFYLLVRSFDEDDETSPGVTESALLYSRVLHESDGLAFLAGTGIGLAERLDGDARRVVSLPLGLRVLYPASGVASIGVHGFASLNGERSFGGATVSLIVGRTR